MKPSFRIVLTFALANLLVAPICATEGTVYGAGVGTGSAVQVSELLDHPDAYLGKAVRIEGIVVKVCEKRGCWMEIAGDREFETMRIKVEDGVIVFPLDAKGKRAIAEGIFDKLELTAEEAAARAKRTAEEKGTSCDAETAKNAPRTAYWIKGTGAVVR